MEGLKLVPFRDVLENIVQEAHAGLQQLAERLPSLQDQERKRALLQHLQATRQRLQRLHVCAQWAHKAKAVNTCRDVLKAAADHGAALTHTADEFHRLAEELRIGRAPLFDVSTALHILQSGTYRLLPAVIEEELQQPGQRLERPGEVDEAGKAARRRDALRRLDFLLRSKLLASELPPGLRVVRVRGGQATVAAAGGQYRAQLTLVPSPRDDVTLAKYRLPGEAEDAAAGPKEEAEVTQPAAGSVAADQPSTSAAAAAAAGPSSSRQQQEEQRGGAGGWRWQLLSFELLPAAGGLDPPPLLAPQRQWLQQHIEQRMWAAADVEQLLRLGKQAWVTVPQPATAAKEQAAGPPGRAASAPAPSSSLAPSQAPAAAPAAADSKGKQPLADEEDEGPAPAGQGAAAEGPQLPAWAGSPLAAMHSILCQTAGRLALFSLILSDARRLEGGSWKGGLKLSRAGGGSGLRLSYWQQLPCISYPELVCLREGTPYQPEPPAAAAAGAIAPAAVASAGVAADQQAAPALEVSLRQDGSLAVASSPQLHHPQTGEPLRLQLPLDAAASFAADRLLLQAAAHSAAVQLAGVQAALQRGGRLGPAGIHSELALAGSSPAAVAAAADAPLPASPALQLWQSGSLQLSLSVQLRSGRLLLAAGPALLESEQGPAAQAGVAATQQQLDKLQRDAMQQPLPGGSSRGMLAARLAADAVARLSLQLSTRRRIDAAAAAAATFGLQRASLPERLLQHLLPPAALLLAPLSPNTLSLALPAYPPPRDLATWARQQQQRQRQKPGGGGGGGDTGATRCFMLVDFGEVAPPSAAAAAGEQQGAAASGGQQAPAPRVLLAVCACTARGTATRVLQLTELPPKALRDMGQAAAAPAPSGSRKRRASDAAAPAAAAGGEQAAGQPELGLAAAVAWCKQQASWAALRAQLQLLPWQHAEELSIAAPQRKAARLPKLPVIAPLEAWAAKQLAGSGSSGGGGSEQPLAKACATLQLDPGAGEPGAWRVDLSSLYFAHLGQLLERLGVRLAPPAPDAQHMQATGSGLVLRYSLQSGHSVMTGVADLVRLGLLHVSLTRLAASIAANPLAAGAAAAAAAGYGGGSNGIGGSDELDFLLDDPPASGKGGGGLPNGAPAACSNGGAEAAGGGGGSPAWPLPGCGSVQLQEAGLTHLVLVVTPPPAPGGLQQQQQQGAPMRVTVSWPAADASKQQPQQQQQQPRTDAGGSDRSSGGSSGGGGGSSPRLARCRLDTEPPLPQPVAAALAQQLEAGRSDLFLDGLCLAAHSAAAAAQHLAPEAQRAAGLLPGALQLLPAGPGGSTALRLRAQVQQGGRAAALALGFHAAGYTLLQLHPAPGSSPDAVAAWLPQLWQRLEQQVPSFTAVEAAAAPAAPPDSQQAAAAAAQKQQVRQAWVHQQGLGQALAAVLQAVAAPGS